ncbi:hypothetical protein [Herbaspirillum sp. YR522]|uniref:hypothetical protein n=1 Tax=Herbaspirillum sp. YR522 TaxID=1144342 RepID=UPI0012F90B61|nr:hypothetical protein [Herbaspirillum sp. YR522]
MDHFASSRTHGTQEDVPGGPGATHEQQDKVVQRRAPRYDVDALFGSFPERYFNQRHNDQQ